MKIFKIWAFFNEILVIWTIFDLELFCRRYSSELQVCPLNFELFQPELQLIKVFSRFSGL